MLRFALKDTRLALQYISLLRHFGDIQPWQFHVLDV